MCVCVCVCVHALCSCARVHVCVCVCMWRVCMCVSVFKIIISSHAQESTIGTLHVLHRDFRDLKNAMPKRVPRLRASDSSSSAISATCPSPTDRGRGGGTTSDSGLGEDQRMDHDGTVTGPWARIKRDDTSVGITRARYFDDTQASDQEQADPAPPSELAELSPRLSVTDSCNSRVTLRLSGASSETSSRTRMRAPCSMCGVRVRGAAADEASGKIYCSLCMELLQDMAHIRLSAALRSSDSQADSPSQSSLQTPTEGDEVAIQDDEGAQGNEAGNCVSGSDAAPKSVSDVSGVSGVSVSGVSGVSGVRAMFAAMFSPRSKGSSPATPRGTPLQTPRGVPHTPRDKTG